MYIFDAWCNIIDEIMGKERDLIESAILKCGYSIDWLRDNRDRVKTEINAEPNGNETYKFKVDGEIKFTVKRVCEMKNDSCSIKWTVDMEEKQND